MRNRKNRGSSLMEFVFIAPCLVGLITLVLYAGTQMVKDLELHQIARDVASMAARGTNFNLVSNQLVAARLGQALNWPSTGLDSSSAGNGVIYVSTVTYLDAATCAGNGLANCGNAGYWVFLRTVSFGNTQLHASNYGAPPACVTAHPSCIDSSQSDGSLNSTDSLNTASARFTKFTLLGTPVAEGLGPATGLQPGQPAFVIEVSGITGPWNGGSVGYAVSVF